ncbi:hypothetical protein CSOJ01_09171 [Colletotrichum sojae]|uniref:Uncharacterized protein n=1 Tax=Colletotrichum sojae TaxID=2175907 RepID=A0A8H6J401_9PEZI|nr:hypothetical protein CSOJ01_09171 [Colletotrichum sojae]
MFVPRIRDSQQQQQRLLHRYPAVSSLPAQSSNKDTVSLRPARVMISSEVETRSRPGVSETQATRVYHPFPTPRLQPSGLSFGTAPAIRSYTPPAGPWNQGFSCPHTAFAGLLGGRSPVQVPSVRERPDGLVVG